jgi:hypothetical protein
MAAMQKIGTKFMVSIAMARPCCEDTLHEKTLKEIQETEEKLRPGWDGVLGSVVSLATGKTQSSTQETKVLNQTMN